jgi:hypothetical protein
MPARVVAARRGGDDLCARKSGRFCGRARAIARFRRERKEKHSGRSEQVLIVGGLGRRPIDRLCDGFQASERLTNKFIGRYRALEQINHLGNRHSRRVWVAG